MAKQINRLRYSSVDILYFNPFFSSALKEIINASEIKVVIREDKILFSIIISIDVSPRKIKPIVHIAV